MTKEEILIIQQIKQGNLDTSYDLLIANRSFLCNLYSQLYIQGYYLEEFFSIAYEALLKAARAMDFGKVEYFRGYWKKYILHEYLLEKLRVKYNFSITVYDYSNDRKNSVDSTQNFAKRFKANLATTKTFAEVTEESELRKALWYEIRNTLTKENAYIIWELFYNNRTMASLARELNIGAERVRKRKLRSLEKLRNNFNIQVLARDYYSMPI